MGHTQATATSRRYPPKKYFFQRLRGGVRLPKNWTASNAPQRQTNMQRSEYNSNDSPSHRRHHREKAFTRKINHFRETGCDRSVGFGCWPRNKKSIRRDQERHLLPQHEAQG